VMLVTADGEPVQAEASQSQALSRGALISISLSS
jgi:hypothetical protein